MMATCLAAMDSTPPSVKNGGASVPLVRAYLPPSSCARAAEIIHLIGLRRDEL